MITILLTGRNGQVGWELERELATLGRVVAFGREGMNFADPDAMLRTVREVRPHIIVNAAAYTAVDKAEQEPELAMQVNGIAPGILAEEAKRLSALLVHYSTDYVFDGENQAAYREDDEPNPQSVYGKSKLAGEEVIKVIGCRHLILRTSWVYGMRGENFLHTMLKLGRERDELAVVNDQIGAPTWSRLIAEATAHVLAQILPDNNSAGELAGKVSGIYHLTAGGSTSWHGFAQAIFRTVPDPLGYVVKSIKPIKTSDWPSPAKRPKNSVLSNEKIKNAFGVTLPSWERGLELCMAT